MNGYQSPEDIIKNKMNEIDKDAIIVIRIMEISTMIRIKNNFYLNLKNGDKFNFDFSNQESADMIEQHIKYPESIIDFIEIGGKPKNEKDFKIQNSGPEKD